MCRALCVVNSSCWELPGASRPRSLPRPQPIATAWAWGWKGPSGKVQRDTSCPESCLSMEHRRPGLGQALLSPGACLATLDR